MLPEYDYCILGYGAISSELVKCLFVDQKRILVVTDRKPFSGAGNSPYITYISRKHFLKKCEDLTFDNVVCNLRLDNLSEDLFRKLILASISMNPKKFIQMSSGSVYGETLSPAYEDSPLKPLSSYANLRIAAEEIVSKEIPESVNLIILRISNVYGNELLDDYINRTVHKKVACEELLVYENGDLIRDYLHIDDLIEAVCLIANSTIKLPRILNISTGVPLHLRKILEIIQNLNTRNISRILSQTRPNEVIFESVLNSDKAKKILSWTPRAPQAGISNYCLSLISNN